MKSNIKIGISAKFHKKAPVFYGESNRHIQYLETSIANWIARNGALPFMIPSESESEFAQISENVLNVRGFAEEMDALILQGGVDIHPSLYSEEEIADTGKYDLTRDRYELELIREFINLKKPIFGICRGLQLLNIYFEGQLFSDLEEAGYAKHFDRELENKFSHKIKLVPGSYLGVTESVEQYVVSVHHQGIKKLGRGLEVEALSVEDGLIEAFSKIDEDHFIFAVQWHPEFHNGVNTNLMDANGLFKKFMQVTRNRRFFGDLSFDQRRRVRLGKSNQLTIGVEMELQIIDPNSRDLCPKAPQLLKEIESIDNKVKCEIFQSMIEVETTICTDAHEVEADLRPTCRLLQRIAKENQVCIASGGTHPFARYSERKLTDNLRYSSIIESKQWIARRIAIFGLHCHVGVQDSDQAIDLYRFYLSVAPLLLAISANSPFFESENTGLHSVRTTFFESMPSGGHPPLMKSWSEFEGLLTKMYKSKAITSHKDLWWDVRPSVAYGTIEIRICDMMPSLYENIVLVALIQLLGRCFLDNRDHKIWPALEEWSYRENKWRALRYGINFNFIFNEQGNTVLARDYLIEILDLFSEQIQDYQYGEMMAYLQKNMLDRSPSDRWLELYESGKSLEEIVDMSCSLFEESL